MTHNNITDAEIREIKDTVDEWLRTCTCSEGRDTSDFFLEPGRVLSAELVEASRRCPARRNEVVLAYTLPISAGYVGGLSPQQRRTMTLPEALGFIANDKPEPGSE